MTPPLTAAASPRSIGSAVRRTTGFIASLALIALFSVAGTTVAARTGLPVPGPVLGLIAYGLLLSFGFLQGTVAAARFLGGLLGALIVPPLVGVALFGPVLANGGVRLAVALVVGTLVTGVVTALTFRLAGGAA